MVCRLCDGELGPVLLEINEPDRFERYCEVNPNGYSRKWVECLVCGAVNDVLPPESSERLNHLRSAYYEVDLQGGNIAEKYHKVMTLPPGQSDNWQRVRRIDNFIARWFTTDSGQRRLLDIGAGTGVFISRFLERSAGNWEGVAIEPDPKAAEHLRSLGGFVVREERFSERSGSERFDLVTLNKVIEHVEHPTLLLQGVGKVLSERGVVYVEVPDKLTLVRRPSNDNILGALHYHLYHPRSLAALFERAGLEALHVERVFEPSGKISVFGFACRHAALRFL